MSRSTIFEELNKLKPVKKDKGLILETRGNHIITSAINLLEYIDNNYDEEQADQLLKRFISSIRGRDPERFSRAVAKLDNRGEE